MRVPIRGGHGGGGGFRDGRGDGGGRGGGFSGERSGGFSGGSGACGRSGGPGGRGGRGVRGAGMKGGNKVIVETHRHDGVFIAKGKEDALCTKNMVPSEAVYNEKRISVQLCIWVFYYLLSLILELFQVFIFD